MKLTNRKTRNCFGSFVILLAALAAGGCRHQPLGSVAKPFDFVQMCDPQVGFTEYAEDLGRFEAAVKQVNALGPDLVVICGDLVNAPNEKSFADFGAAKRQFRIPCYAAPGNHDVGSPSTPESLERYRRSVGKDYYSVERKGCRFVVANSQLWKTPLAGETEKQDSWLAKTLENATKRQQRVFVVMHHPLFLKRPDELEEYFNLRPEKRKQLLSLFERSGVVAVLAGHTHTTTLQEYHGIQLVTSETTSRNFDKRPYGFRIWHVEAQGPCRNEFVPLAGQ
jgi:3',5'-cyclic AMP phosphodiesterase CpdA